MIFPPLQALHKNRILGKTKLNRSLSDTLSPFNELLLARLIEARARAKPQNYPRMAVAPQSAPYQVGRE
jgi:hypothetical protein